MLALLALLLCVTTIWALPVLGTVSDRLVCLAIIQSTLPACLLTPSWESAFYLSQPGLEAKATEDLDPG